MMLNGKNLKLLNQFALKAKKQLGVVKIKEMMNDEQYAYNTLTCAAISNDKDLVEITKEISQELQIGTDVIAAIDSFIQSSKSRCKDEDDLHECKYFLVKLSCQLYGVEVNGESYRRAIDGMLLNVDAKDKKKYIDLARKFYRFWNFWGNSTNIEHELTSHKLMVQKEMFIELWANIDNESLTDSESWPLSLYMESIRRKGLEEEQMIVCQRIVKALIVELRRVHLSKEYAYRDVIERIYMLFESEDLRRLFLSVSRDFHHYWWNTYSPSDLVPNQD